MDSSLFASPDIDSFRRQILTWYEAHKRDLPWRGDPDPYHILVSEVMLQQTQVRGCRYWRHCYRFPDRIIALAVRWSQ